MHYFKNAIYLLGETRSQVSKIFFLFVLVSMLDLLGIGIIGPFLSVVFSGPEAIPEVIIDALSLRQYSHSNLVTLLAVMLVIIYAVKSIFGAFIMHTVIRFSQNQQIQLRKELITSYQNMAYSDLMQRNSSELINAIQLMVPNYANLVMFVIQALGDSVVATVIIIFLAWTNPYAFGFLLLITGVCLLGFDILTRHRISEEGRRANESASLIVSSTNESLRGFKEIRVLNKELYFRNSLVHNAKVFANSYTMINFYSMLPKYIFEMIIITFIAGISIATSLMTSDPVKLIPTLGVFGMASIRMIPLARNFSFTMSRMRYTKDTVMKLATDLSAFENHGEGAAQAQDENASNPSIIEIDTVRSIKLENISYTYPASETATLDHISIEIKEGEHIGIVGTSGAGKTTLVDTLLGLLKPTSGRIWINDTDITHQPEVLWQHVAYLPQEIFIIDGSVRQNIALGVPEDEIDAAQLSYAIDQAQINEVITKLPHGLETNLGENGVKLSGGQRQRIALARAFFFNRKILVLDEATSALDMKTEKLIINYLKTMKNNLTVISITHRLNSLDHCDRIMTMNRGKIH